MLDQVMLGSATEVVAALRSGRVSALELTRAVLDRIDAVDGEVNAMASVRRDAALREERTVAGWPYTDQSFWVAHAALPGLPALSAPAGRTPDGLPVGLQVVAPRHEDDTAITFAELLAARADR